MSTATVRKYFPTREDLFRGCTAHFLSTREPPSLESLGRIEDPGERLWEVVSRVYAYHELAFGQTWTAQRLQHESPTMAQSVAAADDFVRALRLTGRLDPGILDGTVEVSLGEEQSRAHRGRLLLVPAMVPHNVRNIGADTARCVGFFASATVASTFAEPIMPVGQRVVGTPPIDESSGVSLPLTWSQVVEMMGVPPAAQAGYS